MKSYQNVIVIKGDINTFQCKNEKQCWPHDAAHMQADPQYFTSAMTETRDVWLHRATVQIGSKAASSQCTQQLV